MLTFLSIGFTIEYFEIKEIKNNTYRTKNNPRIWQVLLIKDLYE